MGHDLTIETAEGMLNVRVAIWVEQNEQLLICSYDNGIQTLPGGRVKFGESTLQAVLREVEEELNETLQQPQLFALIENFFEHKGHAFHEFLHIYKGQLPSIVKSDIENISWLPLAQIAALKPDVLAQLVDAKGFQHIVQKDAPASE